MQWAGHDKAYVILTKQDIMWGHLGIPSTEYCPARSVKGFRALPALQRGPSFPEKRKVGAKNQLCQRQAKPCTPTQPLEQMALAGQCLSKLIPRPTLPGMFRYVHLAGACKWIQGCPSRGGILFVGLLPVRGSEALHSQGYCHVEQLAGPLRPMLLSPQRLSQTMWLILMLSQGPFRVDHSCSVRKRAPGDLWGHMCVPPLIQQLGMLSAYVACLCLGSEDCSTGLGVRSTACCAELAFVECYRTKAADGDSKQNLGRWG
jgi:hypothetical protein